MIEVLAKMIDRSLISALILVFVCFLTSSLKAHSGDQGGLFIVRGPESAPLSYRVDCPDTASKRRRGLMFRKSIPRDYGMLFVFPRKGIASMWMKNTAVSLDMFFINERGTIVHIAENTVPFSEEPIRPPQSVAGGVIAVLEVVAGSAAQKGIRVGHRVVHPAFPSSSLVLREVALKSPSCCEFRLGVPHPFMYE